MTQAASGPTCSLEEYKGDKIDLANAVVGFSQSEKEDNPFRIAETQSIKDEAAKRLRLARNPTPTGVDPLSHKVVDRWYIDRGPFRLRHDSADSTDGSDGTEPGPRAWMIFGLVTDPVCAAGVTAPCNVIPPCR